MQAIRASARRFARLEMKRNLFEIRVRIRILVILLLRYLFLRGLRTADLSVKEYEANWRDMAEKGDVYRDIVEQRLPLERWGKPVTCSPLEVRRDQISVLIGGYLEECGAQRVLEVGSGVGLNLLFLAPRFPNIQFYGLEPTSSGVEASKSLMADPPSNFEEAKAVAPIENVTIIRGSLFDAQKVQSLARLSPDLVFTTAVLEQMHNSIDVALEHIFKITGRHFLFYEEFLEANGVTDYLTLVTSDYFRHSWNLLNDYPQITILDRRIPPYQPSWLKYGLVFGAVDAECGETGRDQ